MTAGYTKEKGLGLSERAGRLEEQREKPCYRKYSILITAHLEKEMQ